MLFLCLKVGMEIQYSLCLKQKGRETLQGDVIDSWEERLRLTLDHFRNENMADFRKNSEAYRRLVREEEEAYAKLDTLNLTEEQREIIEEAFEAQSAAEAEYATESYFCGIIINEDRQHTGAEDRFQYRKSRRKKNALV